MGFMIFLKFQVFKKNTIFYWGHFLKNFRGALYTYDPKGKKHAYKKARVYTGTSFLA